MAQARIAVADKERTLNEMLRRVGARGRLTLPERLASLAEPKAQRVRPAPVQPGRAGTGTAFGSLPAGAFDNGF